MMFDGPSLYADYCACLKKQWPRDTSGYTTIFGGERKMPSTPVAWPFLTPVERAGWSELARSLNA